METGHTERMLLNADANPVDVRSLVASATSAAKHSARAAQVDIRDETDVEPLRVIADLLISVWGTSQHGAPIPYDLLRSIGHAGCNVTAAYGQDGALCGAAVAIVTPNTSSAYSLIAGVLGGDRGVGFALKQHQRAWALGRGLDTMVWTFDPLVSRNARFNLTKLGAETSEYIPNFYGRMDDGINADDDTDRLVAVWSLTTQRAIACSVGEQEQVELPNFTPDDVLGLGPDGSAAIIGVNGMLWCRIPKDIVAVRALAPADGVAWRGSVRSVLTDAIALGYVANGATRTGWYRLVKGGQE